MSAKKLVIDDNTRIIRFLDLNGAAESIGEFTNGNSELSFSFHYGFWHGYKTAQGIQRDTNETLILLKNGRCEYLNEALISCWSIWPEDEDENPWDSFKKSAFTDRRKYIFAITSTIGEVKEIVAQTQEFNNLVYKNPEHIFQPDIIAAPIRYYDGPIDPETLLSNLRQPDGSVMPGIQIIYKQRCNDKGQRYDAEREYRFAIILQTSRFSSSNFQSNTKSFVHQNNQFISASQKHFIKKMYSYYSPNKKFSIDQMGRISRIRHTCFNAKPKIEIVNCFSKTLSPA